MNNEQYDEGHANPGSGAGQAGHPKGREQEKKAIDREANHPGSAANAAGMHGKPQGSQARNASLDWGDPPSAKQEKNDE